MTDFDTLPTNANDEIAIPMWDDSEESSKPRVSEGIHVAALTKLELSVGKTLKSSREGRSGHAIGYQCEFTILEGDSEGQVVRYYAFVGRRDPNNGELFDTQAGRSFKSLVSALGATANELPAAWEGGYFHVVPDLMARKVFLVITHKEEIRYDVRDLDESELTPDDRITVAQVSRIRPFTNKGEKADYIPSASGNTSEIPF